VEYLAQRKMNSLRTAANPLAQADSWPKALAFLKDSLKKAGDR
jgi:hypothetical protein